MKSERYLRKHVNSQEGKHFLITGSSSGIGLEAAKSLLFLGASVTFMVRNREKAKGRINAIEKEFGHPVDAKIVTYDQADPDSIIACINALEEKHFDGIVLSAGIYFPKKGSLGKQGIPITLQVNAIGVQAGFDAFYKRYPNAKYIFINSVANKPPENHDYTPYFRAAKGKRFEDYCISKRIVMDIYALALKKGARAYMTHPGVTKTNIIQNYAPLIKRLGNGFLYIFVHHAWKAALGIVDLCCNDHEAGTYMVPRGPFHISGYPKAEEAPRIPEEEMDAWETFYQQDYLTFQK